MNIDRDLFELEVSFDKQPTFEEFKEAVKFLDEERKNYDYGKILCVYKEPTQVALRGRYKTREKIEITFFTNADGEYCYTASGRRGHNISYIGYKNITSMVLISPNSPEKKAEREKKLNSFWKRVQKNRYDDQTWSDLEKDSFSDTNGRFYYIKKVFDSYTMRKIEQAFENKEKFYYRIRGEKRDFSAEGKLGEDGIYRAWFSSEYSGYCNGDYYLLNLNWLYFMNEIN